MKNLAVALVASLFANVATAVPAHKGAAPFLIPIDNQRWVIGNDVWNMTQGRQYGVKLHYKDRDCVGDAWGHYVSYNGAANDLAWTSASVVEKGEHKGVPFIDIMFTADEGDMHWVIFEGQHGAYQYFVNHNLPTLGEFRTLWRLDNTTFPNGRTAEKDGALPPLSDYIAANKVQDETWLAPDGKSYITKYDWTGWLRKQDYYGVYGNEVGSWYINPGKDDYNGNHAKQELMVHRESSSGDAVQLNMIHGTHFTASSSDVFPDGKMWGPWLWYLNDGSKPDAAARAKKEVATWPYPWLNNKAYHARGKVTGRLVLSDGRPAAGAAVFLGDNNPTKTPLDMGSTYYYTSYADAHGNFEFTNVRANTTYGLQAWSNGPPIADVYTTFLQNNVHIVTKEGHKSTTTHLGTLHWPISNRTRRLFQLGDLDHYSHGFLHGGAPHQHGLVSACPANLVYRIGRSQPSTDWCFGQTHRGNWTIEFFVPDDQNDENDENEDKEEEEEKEKDQKKPTLIVSLAGYSSGASTTIWANGQHQIGNMTSGGGAPELQNDPSLYRSATAAGEWRLLEFPFQDVGVLQRGSLNTVTFELTQNTTWRGFMWDSIILEW